MKILYLSCFRLTIRNVNKDFYGKELYEAISFRLTIRNVNLKMRGQTIDECSSFRLTIRNVNKTTSAYPFLTPMVLD